MRILLFICLLYLIIGLCTSQNVPRRYASQALTNWKDMIITWAGPRNNPNEDPVRSTGLNSVRIASNYTSTGVSADSFAAVILTEQGQTISNYTDSTQWDGDSYLETSGGFVNLMETYQLNSVSQNLLLKRTFYLPPQQDFYIVKYTIQNPTSQTIKVRILDYLNTDHPSSSQPVYGWYNSFNNLLMADETKSGGFYLASAIFNPPSNVKVISQALGSINSGPNSLLSQFQTSFQVSNVTVYEANQASLGTVFEVTLNSSQTTEVSFYRTLQENYNDCISVAKIAATQTAQQWIDSTNTSYSNFLSQGKPPPSFLNPNEVRLYQVSILNLKNSQNPTTGGFIASFHPAYGYKVWARDGAFSALIMDSVGYTNESEQFLKYLSNVPLRSDGAFHTCYDWYSYNDASFVEPEYDACGIFLLSSYYHYTILQKNNKNGSAFLNSIKSRIDQINGFLVNQKGLYGLVPPDYSIWEESSDPKTGDPLPTSYFSFTQGMGYSGLVSSSLIYKVLGENSNQQQASSRAEDLKNAINQYLYMPEGYFARAIWSNDSTVDTRRDSSSNAIIYGGASNSLSRSISHVKQIVSNLTQLDWGMARYWGDIFFYDSKFNPGGREVGAPNPPWGVCTAFTAWAEYSIGINTTIVNRLNWMSNHTAPYQMPVGEAVDGVTGLFVQSSCPDLYEYGGVYLETALIASNQVPIPNPLKF